MVSDSPDSRNFIKGSPKVFEDQALKRVSFLSPFQDSGLKAWRNASTVVDFESKTEGCEKILNRIFPDKETPQGLGGLSSPEQGRSDAWRGRVFNKTAQNLYEVLDL